MPVHHSRPGSPALPNDSPGLSLVLAAAASHFLDDGGGRRGIEVGVDAIRGAAFWGEENGVERTVHG